MSDKSEMYFLPTEILLDIFMSLPIKDLMKCREVCVRWRLIIDKLARSDFKWSKHCKEDFSNVYKVARKKAKPGLLWYNLYCSLALWQRIAMAREYTDEFASASCLDEEIRSFELLGNSVIGVHKKSSIVYYDADTLQESNRGPISGDYSRYTENDSVIVILNYHRHCFVVRKALCNRFEEESNVTFPNVTLYTLTENALYFVNFDHEIFVCNFDDKQLQAVFLKQSGDGIISIGYSDGHLNVLTFQRDIFTIIGHELVYKCSLGPDTNLLHQLQKYNFLEQLDWRVYFQWMSALNYYVPYGALQDISIIRPYGDVYFVGSNWGVLRIYYAPYLAGELDIFNSQPAKEYDFMEQSDCPDVSICKILQVDVFEVEDGHRVLVAMPKKIAVLNLTHTLKRTRSLAMLPYSKIEKVKCLKISQYK